MLKIILIGWIVGISAMGRDFEIINSTWWIWCCIATLLFIFYKIKNKGHSPFYKSLLLITAIWAMFCAGYHYADQALEKRLELRELKSQPFEAVVYIRKINELTEEGVKQQAVVLNRHDQVVNWLMYIKEKDHQPEAFVLGRYYRVYGTIKPAHSYAVQGVFDQEKWFLQQNLMSAFLVEQIVPLSQDEVYRLGHLQYLKEQDHFFEKIGLKIEIMRFEFRQMLAHSNLQHKGLLLALLTGDESLLAKDLKKKFQQLGISHLLAISGPHVLIFAIMLTWGLQRVLQHYFPNLYLWQPRQIILAFPFLFSVMVYVAFVGFEIPALRTLLTVALASFFVITRQAIQPFQLLIYSACLFLIYDPFSILSAAFWLSYGACFILLRIYQTISTLPKDRIKNRTEDIKFAIKILIESQWKIFIALMPLVIIFFQQIAWIAPLSNLIAIPILSMLVVPLDIFAACVWLIFPSLGLVLFTLNNMLLSILIGLLDVLMSLTPDLQGISYIPLSLFALSVGILILFMPKGTIPKSWGLVCFLPILFGAKQQKTMLTILDVGQGQSVFLQQAQHNLMIDTGGSYNEEKFSLGERVIVPFLRQQGIEKLDQMILSHLDQDHSGAFPYIEQAFEITKVYANEKNDKLPFKDNFSFCHQGQKWNLAQAQVEILSPKMEELSYVQNQQNEYSCVVYIEFEHAKPYRKFLIMGDAGWETEYKLLKQYPDLEVDVIVLGHHGSKHSSAYDFLARIKPKLAIASAGFENRYGHPSIELQQRLRTLNIPLLTTSQNGSISFEINHANTVISMYRQQRKWLTRLQ